MHDAADDPSSTLAVCKLISTCLSVARCQYCPRYRKITLTVANVFTYLLHRITKTTELTRKLFLNSIFNEVLLRTRIGFLPAKP